jgi:hypothetical protein
MSNKQLALIVYILYFVAYFTGLTSLIGVIKWPAAGNANIQRGPTASLRRIVERSRAPRPCAESSGPRRIVRETGISDCVLHRNLLVRKQYVLQLAGG